MNDIGQKEYLELEIEQSEIRRKKVEEIQKAYRRYRESPKDVDFEHLILLLEELTLSWVRKQLWRAGCYSDENEHETLQEAREAVWKTIAKDAETAVERADFAYYAFGIYKKKALDVVRRISRKRARMKRDQIELISTEMEIGDTKTTVGEMIVLETDDLEEIKERREAYGKLFKTYCRAFLNAKVFPPRSLALYYARVLPHFLEEIPDTKIASAKWAFERMVDQSVQMLKEDSETTLCEEIDESLTWGRSFTDQLNQEIDVMGDRVLLRDVIYTAVYSKDEIEDWADSMHRTTVKSAAKLICADKELLELAKTNILSGSKLISLVKGGKQNEAFGR